MDDLELKSEAIEREALLSLYQHCPEDTREALGLFVEEVGDALVFGASNDPSILLNRTLGLGSAEPVTRARIEQIDALYRDRAIGRYFLHVYAHDLSRGESTFDGTGLVKARGWMRFRRDSSEPLERETELDILRVGPANASDFGRIVAAAFGMTETAGPLLAGMVADPRWHLYLSYDGECAVGAGGLFIFGDVAWLDWGATEAAFRRRGSQGAIMRARIQAARGAGCAAMFTETGEASGDDPQHSYGNIQRFGFNESILRQNWQPAQDIAEG